MDQRPIGVFDSGLGGLTAVKEILKIMPNEDVIYFGDTGRVPYGNKSVDTILNYALQDISFLTSMNVKFIVIACGTVSSVIQCKSNLISTPFTGVLAPTCAAAANATKNNKIGVIGTTATINSNSYKKNLQLLNPIVEVFQQDCPLFVPMIENGYILPQDNLVKETVKNHLAGLKQHGIDTLILGCTHYPIISEAIQNFMGENVTLIDSGKETARYLKNTLEKLDLLTNRNTKGDCKFFVSDCTENFSRTASLFLGQNISSNVKKIDVSQYSVVR